MLASTFLLPALAALLAPAQGQPTASAEARSYRSIELRGGGTVTIRHGPVRRITVVAPNPDREIRSEADRLVVERCGGDCPRGHRIEIDVVTPELAELAVTDGGTIQLAGVFPAQAAIAASVRDGGTIDIRPLDAASVSASVSQGGRILTRPRRQLAVSIADGGVVTYWGEAQVSSSVRRGGVVARGVVAELRAPLTRPDAPSPRLKTLVRAPAPPAPPTPPRTD